jgi:hypothetical protein
MPTYVREAIPTEARRSTLDPELAAWLKDAPRLGAHVPVPVARTTRRTDPEEAAADRVG